MVGFDSSAGKVVYRTTAALDYNETADIISRSECPPAVVMNLTEPGDKHQRYGALITGVFSWALNNHPPANLILVVGDVAEHEYRFVGVFTHLISSGYNVAFVQPENQASQILFRLGRRIWLWEKLSLGEGPIRKQKPPNF
ncbi:BnaCnng42370D, partial [Brassica napus]